MDRNKRFMSDQHPSKHKGNKALLPTFGADVVFSGFIAFGPPLRSAEFDRCAKFQMLAVQATSLRIRPRFRRATFPIRTRGIEGESRSIGSQAYGIGPPHRQPPRRTHRQTADHCNTRLCGRMMDTQPYLLDRTTKAQQGHCWQPRRAVRLYLISWSFRALLGRQSFSVVQKTDWKSEQNGVA